MPLAGFSEMMKKALENEFAVGYFEAWNLDSLEAVLEAAQEARAPVLLGFGGMTVNQDWFEQGGMEYLAAMGRVAVKSSSIPVSFILNEVKTYQQCMQGMELGFNVVMMDSSSLSFEQNLTIHRKLVKAAHARSVDIQAELGHLPVGGYSSASSLTDPKQAGEFVRETNVDALAVSIGNVHILTRGEADVDLELLKRIRKEAGIPLVIHGGTGFPSDSIKDVIREGVTLFHVGSVLKMEYFRGIKSAVREIDEEKEDIQTVVGSRKKEDFTCQGKKRIRQKVKQLIELYGSWDKAQLFF
ncbi:MAG: class II fructose-bisphosphate aldolase [Spirochaetota bacterium]